jgi:hypothetical protein
VVFIYSLDTTVVHTCVCVCRFRTSTHTHARAHTYTHPHIISKPCRHCVVVFRWFVFVTFLYFCANLNPETLTVANLAVLIFYSVSESDRFFYDLVYACSSRRLLAQSELEEMYSELPSVTYLRILHVSVSRQRTDGFPLPADFYKLFCCRLQATQRSWNNYASWKSSRTNRYRFYFAVENS